MDLELGTGWHFPTTFNEEESIEMVHGKQDIHQSLRILLSTKPGERPIFFDYGCNLHLLLFESITEELKVRISSTVSKAIEQFEKRITVDKVSVDDSEQADGKVNIMIDYTINKSQTTGNFIFPYYLD
ncbi:GPW/gp25 family protein [Persicobacter diffluens]|uniref:IraD/Gp25-like domain-containing protein n=1 Tax=Persicobacter diffluens TaxID=981 RepID=A0AAN5AM50_9BACT|nr:hypothetical protein PEDI_39990 [Persicobacter diffluens]